MSYNSLSTILALIPAVPITLMFIFGNHEQVIGIIKRRSTMIILFLFCALQIFLHLLHYPLWAKLLASVSVTTWITIIYVFEFAWPLLRFARYIR
jgi:hypothetical protein